MQITAAMVKELRELTGAGMSACKNALVEANGDIKRASEILREKGLAAAAKKAGRIAAEGLVMAAVSDDRKSGVLVEVNSETDFVAKNDDFISFVKNMAKHALASSAETTDALLEEKWVEDSSQTAKEVLTNKIATIGENIGLRRFERYCAKDGGAIMEYIHGGGRIGAMVHVTAPEINDSILEAARNVCMQIASMSPQYLCRADMPADKVEKEREFILNQIKKEDEESGKARPAQIIEEKILPGRLDKSLNEFCLLEQEYVKEGKQTVGDYLKSVNPDLKIVRFTRYEKGEGIEKAETDFAAEVAEAMKG